MTKNRMPWRVYAGLLRPRFPARVVEIHDATGATVLPWTAFDHLSPASAKRLARQIVRAVNRDALGEGNRT